MARFVDAVLATDAIRSINPAGITGLLGNKPEDLYRFVRDEIRFEAYTGILRGARGTLLARAGNAYDQAILLKSMFDSIGVPCRLIRGILPDEAAKRLLQTMTANTSTQLPLLSDRDIEVLGIDAGRFQRAWSKQLERRDTFLESIIADSMKDAAALGINSNGARLGMAASTVRDYLWVQIFSGGVWLDMHPAFPKGERIEVNPEGIINYIASLPPEFFHWVRVRLIGQRLVEDGFQRMVLLDKRLLASVAAGETISVELRPEEVEGSGKVNLQPAVRIGETILVADPVELPASDGSSTRGALTAVWLEITVLSPMERARVQTITLAESYPAALTGENDKEINPGNINTLSDSELQVRAELVIASSGIDPRILIRDAARTLRWIGNARQAIGRDFDPGMHGYPTTNPVLSRWNVLLNEGIERAIPGKTAYLDTPAIAVMVFRPVKQESGMRLETVGGLTHFHTASPEALGSAAGVPGILANRLLEELVSLQGGPSRSVPNGYKKIDKAALEGLQGNAWDETSRRELEYDLVRGLTVYLAEGVKLPGWWRMEGDGIDPVLRREGGWSLQLPVAAYSPGAGLIAFGEMLRALCESGADGSAAKRFEKAVDLYFSRYFSAEAFSPLRAVAEGKYGEKVAEVLQ